MPENSPEETAIEDSEPVAAEKEEENSQDFTRAEEAQLVEDSTPESENTPANIPESRRPETANQRQMKLHRLKGNGRGKCACEQGR